MKSFFLAAFLLLASDAAYAQLYAASGTTIVIEITNDELVIAADSRAVSNGAHDDTICKISAFKAHHAIFSATGNAFPNNGKGVAFNAFNNAKSVFAGPVNRHDFGQYIDGVTHAWSKEGEADWTKILLVGPDFVRKLAQERLDGNLITGIFAVASGKDIEFRLGAVFYQDGYIKTGVAPYREKCAKEKSPCTFGHRETVIKYLGLGKDYMTASPKMLKKYGDPLLRVVRLVELSIAEDKSGFVGGPIDALSLHKDGSIHWYRKKANCPESSD